VGELENRIAVVTGAGSGIGRATVLRFAEAGANVVAVDIDKSSLDETCEAITRSGGEVEGIVADVASDKDLASLADHLTSTHGIVHVLFSNAGIVGPSGLDVDPDEWDRVAATNMKASFFLTSLLAELLTNAESRGSIIYTSSTSGLVGSPFSPLYSMTKGALIAFSRSVALALAPHGVRANAICPGPIDTPMLRGAFMRPGTEGPVGDGWTDEAMATFVASIPLARAGDPREVAEVVLFLASDAARFITGTAIPVDGGALAS
jgi:NAD(P)-dependent dehydrogenase (short-subunit alcohol dehydrogenase family)